jgi:hypothetical protein
MMIKEGKKSLPAFLLAALGTLTGCDTDPGLPKAFGNREISWDEATSGKPAIGGIDNAEVDFGIWGDGAALVIWSDAGCELGGGGMANRQLEAGETRKGVKYEGDVRSKDGRSWKVSCYTRDGKTGAVKIGDQTFDLADGALFLLSTRGDRPRVKQLKQAKLDLTPEGSRTVSQIEMPAIRELGKSDPDIKAFFTGAAAAK